MALRRRMILIVLGLLVLGAAALVLLTDITGTLPIDIGLRLTTRKQTSVSIGILEEIRDIYTFHTVEYIHRTVFPYDLLPQDVNIDALLRKVRRAREDTVAEALTTEEFSYLRSYNLAQELGIGTDQNDGEFLVVTVVVRAGFDLEGTVFADRGSTDGEGTGDIGDAVQVEEVSGAGRSARRITVRLPETTITDIVVEDVVPADYPYPDVELAPEGWRAVADLVANGIRQETVDAGILDRARANGRRFVETLLEQAGFDEVRFVP